MAYKPIDYNNDFGGKVAIVTGWCFWNRKGDCRRFDTSWCRCLGS